MHRACVGPIPGGEQAGRDVEGETRKSDYEVRRESETSKEGLGLAAVRGALERSGWSRWPTPAPSPAAPTAI